MNTIKLSKLTSYILRHKPEAYNITLDDGGWVDISLLIEEIVKKHPQYALINQCDFDKVTKLSGKQRFDITDGRIKAHYGHSIKTTIVREKAYPPEILYHGTPIKNVEVILSAGLKPMNRQHVHMSSDKETAEIVAKRWQGEYLILKVNAQQAHGDGIGFYRGNENIWLADHVPHHYITE